MARYIDADEMEYNVLHLDVDVAEHKCTDYDSYINGANQFRHQVKLALRHTPTADVVEEVHGQWIKTDSFDNFKTPIYQCSVCIREVADNYIHLHKYCLHCGAKMDGMNLSESPTD